MFAAQLSLIALGALSTFLYILHVVVAQFCAERDMRYASSVIREMPDDTLRREAQRVLVQAIASRIAVKRRASLLAASKQSEKIEGPTYGRRAGDRPLV